jgi:hypothetical protein
MVLVLLLVLLRVQVCVLPPLTHAGRCVPSSCARQLGPMLVLSGAASTRDVAAAVRVTL